MINTNTQNNIKLQFYFEVFMTTLALISVILVIGDMLSIIDSQTQAFKIAEIILLSIFWLDYLIRLFISENKKEFFRDHFFDFLAILPLSNSFAIFRLIRILRLAKVAQLGKVTKLVNVFGAITKFNLNTNNFLRTNGFVYLLYSTIVLIFFSAILMAYAENISFSDALWWAIVTCTTVGYGDITPVTSLGRFVAIFLMIFGIGFLGILTSTITTFVSTVAKNKRLKLMEENNLKNNIQNNTKNTSNLSEDYVELLNLVNELDETQQSKLLAFGRSLKK